MAEYKGSYRALLPSKHGPCLGE